MAQKKLIPEIRKKANDLTLVKSKTYGDHTRAKRGTYKPALLNDALQKSGVSLLAGNKAAKTIFDALAPYRADFGGGQLWQHLVSVFKKQASSETGMNIGALRGLDIHDTYLLRKLAFPVAEVLRKEEKLVVEIKLPSWPVFRNKKYINGFRMQVVFIFCDENLSAAESEDAWSALIGLPSKQTEKEVPDSILYEFAWKPAFEKDLLLCLKMEGWENGRVATHPGTKGMAVLKAGKLAL